ncbi:hypothetical protein SP21_81 [Salmonella phage 21]|nr:hypothetical protein SP21_81 [Salmonella phage 21]
MICSCGSIGSKKTLGDVSTVLTGMLYAEKIEGQCEKLTISG